MFSLNSCLRAIVGYRSHWSYVIPKRKEKIAAVAQQSLQHSKQPPRPEEPSMKVKSGLLPYTPEPDSPDYEEWLKLFEKAIKDIIQTGKR